MSRRRSTRSTSTPPGSANSNHGSQAAPEAAATISGSLVLDATSNGVAMVARPAPSADVLLAAHSFANRRSNRSPGSCPIGAKLSDRSGHLTCPFAQPGKDPGFEHVTGRFGPCPSGNAPGERGTAVVAVISPAPVTHWQPGTLPAYLSNGLIGLRVGHLPLRYGVAMLSGFEGLDPETRVEASARVPYPLAGDIRIGEVSMNDHGRAT